MSDRFDVLVIGAGQAGRPLALDLARAGRRTALIERRHVGGTCVNTGCTPTKAMVASARVAYLARRAADFGVEAGDVRVALASVRARQLVDGFRAHAHETLESQQNLELIEGAARFVGTHALAVTLRDGGRRRVESDVIVIDTGCEPARPELASLDEVRWLDSTTILDLGELPEHLLVLGGGRVGLEYAQMFRRFGSRVTIVQRAARLLHQEDDDVADAVANVLREDGIELCLASEATRVRAAGAEVELSLRAAAGERRMRGSHLLVVVGRTPSTHALDAARAGIALDERGYIRVDERLATSTPGIYAAGDVTGGPAFTHVAYDDYRILRENLLHGGTVSTRGRLAPWTLFIDPELAHAGLREREARAAGRRYRLARMPMSAVARALELDEPRGFMKALVDPDTGLILGFTVLGVNGGELMSVVAMAMLGGVDYRKVREAIFVHPTLAESLNNLFAKLE